MSGTAWLGADIGGTNTRAVPKAGGAPAFAEAFTAHGILAGAVVERPRRVCRGAGAEPSRFPEVILGAAPPAGALRSARPSPSGPGGPAFAAGDPRAWPVLAGLAPRGRSANRVVARGRAPAGVPARTVGRAARAGGPR